MTKQEFKLKKDQLLGQLSNAVILKDLGEVSAEFNAFQKYTSGDDWSSLSILSLEIELAQTLPSKQSNPFKQLKKSCMDILSRMKYNPVLPPLVRNVEVAGSSNIIITQVKNSTIEVNQNT